MLYLSIDPPYQQTRQYIGWSATPDSLKRETNTGMPG
jgi:hypothetical protein